MQIAHLILAHNNPKQVEKLVKRLIYDDDAVYIHLDKKSAIEPYRNLQKLNNVYFVEKRVDITWGAYSIVEATINGFEHIINTGIDYQFVNLLSGADYPLQTPGYIHEYLSRFKGKIFMSYRPIYNEWKDGLPRVIYYHLTHYKFKGRFKLQHLINMILPKRKMPYDLVPVGCSQWFTASKESVAYIINYWRQHSKLRRFIKLTWGADEFLFQTILYNSPYREQIINDHLRHMDWSAGGVSPKVFTLADKDTLLSSDKLYARKFDLGNHPDIINLIDQKLDELK